MKPHPARRLGAYKPACVIRARRKIPTAPFLKADPLFFGFGLFPQLQNNQIGFRAFYVKFLRFLLNLLQFLDHIRNFIEQFEIHLLIIGHFIILFAL